MDLCEALKEQRDIERWADRDDPTEFAVQDTDGTPLAIGPKHSELQGLDADDHKQYFHKTLDDSDVIPEGDAKKFLTTDQKSHLTGGGDGDAEHKHASKMDKAITALTEKVTPHDNDVVVVADSEAAGALKKVKVSNIGGSGGAYYEPVTNGDLTTPEIVFHDGDIVMAEV